ncbi:MAG TPA: sugar phosphate nucleotidyltransferase [Planctomycetota bacterium]
MTSENQNWAIVLAAGEGTRLRELTTARGVSTPKQYCSLRGGRSLLGDALARAARVVPKKRIVVVVAEEHRRFFEPDLAGLPRENVVVQPRNRGTAAGILLPLSVVLERDPGARIAFLPSDHFVEREPVLESALRLALESLAEEPEALTLLGITPDGPETGYGWIVPATSPRLLRPVARFVEKPAAHEAAELFAAGALWNSFLFAVRGATLAALYRRHLPELAGAFAQVFAVLGATRRRQLEALYETLATRDFSREVLQASAAQLRLEVVPPCGWTDLGTPERVEACLASLTRTSERESTLRPEPRAAFDLAQAFRGFAAGGAAALPA